MNFNVDKLHAFLFCFKGMAYSSLYVESIIVNNRKIIKLCFVYPNCQFMRDIKACLYSRLRYLQTDV